MQVVILAGGKGTRIESVAGGRPKSLVSVAGKPFIDHQLEWLAGQNLRDVLLCIGHLGHYIEDHVKDGSRWGLRVNYSYEDPHQLRGTGGALVQAVPILKESFLLMYGDSYLPIDFHRVIETFESTKAQAVMCVFRNEGQWDSSNVRVEKNKIVFYSKKAKPGEADYIDYGLSAFRRSVIERYLSIKAALDLATIQSDLVQSGELVAHVVTESRFYEIGRPEGVAELTNYFEAKKRESSTRT